MTRARSTHGTKTPGERKAYQNTISRIENQPTADDEQAIDFGTSRQVGEDLTEPKSRRKRSIPFTTRLSEHIHEHWLEWIIGIVIFIGLYFMYDARLDIAVISADLTNQNEKISELKTDIKSDIQDQNTNYQKQLDVLQSEVDSNKDQIHAQDLVIREFQTTLDFLRQELDKISR
jgi:hypothetical protein